MSWCWIMHEDHYTYYPVYICFLVPGVCGIVVSVPWQDESRRVLGESINGILQIEEVQNISKNFVHFIWYKDTFTNMFKLWYKATNTFLVNFVIFTWSSESLGPCLDSRTKVGPHNVRVANQQVLCLAYGSSQSKCTS